MITNCTVACFTVINIVNYRYVADYWSSILLTFRPGFMYFTLNLRDTCMLRLELKAPANRVRDLFIAGKFGRYNAADLQCLLYWPQEGGVQSPCKVGVGGFTHRTHVRDPLLSLNSCKFGNVFNKNKNGNTL